MKYYDLNGKAFEEANSQDKLLKALYGSFPGRLAVNIMINPFVSKVGGWFLNTSVSSLLIKGFVEKNNIDLSQYECDGFKSYNGFFTRKIKEGMRPFDEDKNVLVSPSDGKVSVYEIDENSVFEIKNSKYTCKSILRNKRLAKEYEGGYAFVIRLTVDDYHRYCYPCDGVKGRNLHIDGFYHTVNPVAFEYYEVFKENTREYCVINSEVFGKVVMLEVGATMVGKITNNHKEPARVKKGEEKGRFEFGGSTIVLLVKKDAVKRPDELIKRTNQGFETIVRQGNTLSTK